MGNVLVFDGGTSDTSQILQTLGYVSTAPPPPTAPVFGTTAPTVSTTPIPGQGIALDLGGRLPTSVNQTLPGFMFGFQKYTAAVPFTATTEATATAIVTAPAINFDGQTAVNLDVWVPFIQPGTANWAVAFYDALNGAAAVSIGTVGNGTVLQAGVLFNLANFIPAAGPHVYSLRGYVPGGGTGTAYAGTGGVGNMVPGWIKITRV